MKNTSDKLIQLILRPESVGKYVAKDWNDLVSQARYHELITFVQDRLEKTGFYSAAPKLIQELMDGYQVRLEYQKKLFLWEHQRLTKWCSQLDYPVVYLKGMAYLVSGISTYRSRGFSDIDLLIPEEHFREFEELLHSHGWSNRELNEYDDHYYRQWSHASPPMTHHESGLELDLHHHISSPISDLKIDSRKLFDEVVKIPGQNCWRLSDADLILHCANHFIYFDELQGRFKDLIFIYFLIEESDDVDIWEKVDIRARELGLERTLYYLICLLEYYFRMHPPKTMVDRLNNRYSGVVTKLTFLLLRNCLTPVDPESISTRLSTGLLVARYQWTRYPLLILVKHLIQKHFLSTVKSWSRKLAPLK